MVANAKKIIAMERVQGPTPAQLYGLYMASHQELEILQMLMPKIAKFLERLYIDIEGPLLVIFLDFQYFLSIKDNAWDMFSILLIKTKGEIYDKLIDFRIWIKNLLDRKIKCICLRRKLRSNIFDVWFKATSIHWKLLVPYTPQQNGKIEHRMYILISIVRLVLKEFWLPKRLWNKIVQTIAYVKNCTISRIVNAITSYKGVNKSIPSIAHLCALRY